MLMYESIRNFFKLFTPSYWKRKRLEDQTEHPDLDRAVEHLRRHEIVQAMALLNKLSRSKDVGSYISMQANLRLIETHLSLGHAKEAEDILDGPVASSFLIVQMALILKYRAQISAIRGNCEDAIEKYLRATEEARCWAPIELRYLIGYEFIFFLISQADRDKQKSARFLDVAEKELGSLRSDLEDTEIGDYREPCLLYLRVGILSVQERSEDIVALSDDVVRMHKIHGSTEPLVLASDVIQENYAKLSMHEKLVEFKSSMGR